MVSRWLVAASLVLVAACSDLHEAPGEGTCQFEPLPDGAVVHYAFGGGIAGKTSAFTAFADGRVDVSRDRSRAKLETKQVDAARVERLRAEILGTGIADEDEGCYSLRGDVDDGSGGSLVLRRDGDVLRFASGNGAGPEEVGRALDVARAFLDEVDPPAR